MVEQWTRNSSVEGSTPSIMRISLAVKAQLLTVVTVVRLHCSPSGIYSHLSSNLWLYLQYPAVWALWLCVHWCWMQANWLSCLLAAWRSGGQQNPSGVAGLGWMWSPAPIVFAASCGALCLTTGRTVSTAFGPPTLIRGWAHVLAVKSRCKPWWTGHCDR